MKNIKLVLFFFCLGAAKILSAQSFEEATISQKGVLNVYYFENEPYAYTAKNGKEEGIEIDIIKTMAEWAKDEKGLDLTIKYKGFKEFDEFYRAVQTAPVNTIGLGSVTITKERMNEVIFTAPYLKNVSVLVTDGSVPTARSEEQLARMILNLRPITIKGSVHERYLGQLYKMNEYSPQYEYVEEVMMIPNKIEESAKYYGYVDIISFWKYLKMNKHFVKMHQVANKENENFGFIMPQTSGWSQLSDEFFERGFGFTSTKAYHKILEKYLGFEVIERVELN